MNNFAGMRSPLWPGQMRRMSEEVVELKPATNSAAITSTPLTVETFQNHLYFWSDVDSDRCLALLRSVRDLDSMLRNERTTRGIEHLPPTPIWLHIQSYGGDLMAGFAVSDQLAQIQTPIYTVIEGVAASAATLIALAGNRRYIQPTALMMIHQFSSVFWGTHAEFKDEAKIQELLIERLYAFYVLHSHQERAFFEEKLTHNYWMGADEAKTLGFVDEIVGTPAPENG